jgi:hypothetical protein
MVLSDTQRNRQSGVLDSVVLSYISFLSLFYRYTLFPYLLTPVKDPRNDAEERYNSRHKRARSIVERAFGLLKMRFLCLHKYGGALMYSPERCIRIIVSCLILHNICLDYNIELDDQLIDDGLEEDDDYYNNPPPQRRGEHDRLRQAGIDTRAGLIRTHFT